MLLRFSKMHGLGNDFMVIDLVTQKAKLTDELIRKWGDRHFGIGFDQLLVVEPPSKPNIDFKYRIFNSDGSEVEQCGNGARCFARFVRDEKLTDKSTISVETKSGEITLKLTGDQFKEVVVDMGEPIFEPRQIPFNGKSIQPQYSLFTEDFGEVILGAVSMGNPHGVLKVDSVETAAVENLGPILENHPDFPEKANIGFMELVNDSHIKLRVFERGVGETLACGTGACAAMAVAHSNGWVSDRVKVSLPGGDLWIEWHGSGSVIMTGPAEKVFEGRIKA